MKRLALLFLILMALPACGGVADATGGWEQQVKLPAERSNPEVLQAMEQVWQPTATAAAATATAVAVATITAPPATATSDPLDGIGAIESVEGGESLSSISQKWNCPQEAILRANQDLILDPDEIEVGWEIKIPASCTD